jgi:hypothetical protein
MADMRMIYPGWIITRDDQERAQNLLALFGWDRICDVCSRLAAKKPKYFTGEISDACFARWAPDDEDYTRAGLTPPPKKAKK